MLLAGPGDVIGSNGLTEPEPEPETETEIEPEPESEIESESELGGHRCGTRSIRNAGRWMSGMTVVSAPSSGGMCSAG